MPIYEYACDKCDHEFEVEQRISDDPVKTCPKCRSRKVKRLISRTSFVLKGSGWYSDLYSSKKAEKGDAKSDAKSDGGDDKGKKAETRSDAPAGDAKKSEAKPKSEAKAKSEGRNGKSKAA